MEKLYGGLFKYDNSGFKKSDHGLHPTQKPIELLKALIELSTVENQLVLDPFCGSGSTLLAAHELKRNYIGIDNNANYVEIAKKRLASSSL